MYLLDTNIWLELLLGQERAGEVKAMFSRADMSAFAMTDFTLYSTGLLLARHGKEGAFHRFVQDTLASGVRVVRLPPTELPTRIAEGRAHGLDFDDAYQYAACRLHDLRLVSFDRDFDKTPEGRTEPADVAAAGR